MNIFRLLGDLSHTASILMLLLKLRASKSASGVSLKTQELFLVVFLARYIDLFFNFVSLYNSLMKVLYISLTSFIVYMIREQAHLKATYDKTQDSFLHWKFAVAPCALFGLIVHVWDSNLQTHRLFSLLNLLWIFSEVLEPMAIIPQLVMLQRYRDVENLTVTGTEEPRSYLAKLLGDGHTSGDEYEYESPEVCDQSVRWVEFPGARPTCASHGGENAVGHYIFLMGAYRLMYIFNWVYRANHEKNYQHHPLLYFAGGVQTLLFADFFYYYGLSKYYGSRLSLPA